MNLKLNDALKRIMENKNWTKEELEKFSSFVEAITPNYGLLRIRI